ncbi:hypothetical protein H072_11568 [Dactylellina haptotyla CBS 200.50]|uniref:Uncharacterized protein n=1 Tax=Dactylellina haptotyla (strain CBS 200.50) TaxID=1284197 RepID=S7ZXP7_DACHA|nr:hypothetical protein H072_11568 [Dactylellina haptotyla CBS 200.50]
MLSDMRFCVLVAASFHIGSALSASIVGEGGVSRNEPTIEHRLTRRQDETGGTGQQKTGKDTGNRGQPRGGSNPQIQNGQQRSASRQTPSLMSLDPVISAFQNIFPDYEPNALDSDQRYNIGGQRQTGRNLMLQLGLHTLRNLPRIAEEVTTSPENLQTSSPIVEEPPPDLGTNTVRPGETFEFPPGDFEIGTIPPYIMNNLVPNTDRNYLAWLASNFPNSKVAQRGGGNVYDPDVAVRELPLQYIPGSPNRDIYPTRPPYSTEPFFWKPPGGTESGQTAKLLDSAQGAQEYAGVPTGVQIPDGFFDKLPVNQDNRNMEIEGLVKGEVKEEYGSQEEIQRIPER